MSINRPMVASSETSCGCAAPVAEQPVLAGANDDNTPAKGYPRLIQPGPTQSAGSLEENRRPARTHSFGPQAFVWVAQIGPLPTLSTSARVESNKMIQGATSQSDAGCDTCLDALSPIDCIPSFLCREAAAVSSQGWQPLEKKPFPSRSPEGAQVVRRLPSPPSGLDPNPSFTRGCHPWLLTCAAPQLMHCRSNSPILRG
ncbi:hypothetical protein Pan216_54140 [Planctomycetes bacterium Pan216]|uniref:Uncharacterized protein n=1 Tax=Kolteria novifilia TaxID=2527975 RepID=A0A518BC11_9BACT|nr:hypothetical protein Pan216_54140 [Planctomycetes bacterium Pan216]